VEGRLFLCGKHAVGPDPQALLDRIGATTVVCLNEPHELEDRYPQLLTWLEANGPERAVHHPIPDLHAPDVDDLAALVDELHARLRAGEGLVVTCGAGIGRAGTVATAVLMREGAARTDALATVRAHRPMAGPESGPQTEVLADLERRWTA
jgi:protein-tyrosine phosphatase